MKRGEATINESEVLLLESYPVQVVLSLKGTFSTPCNHLRAKVEKPDAENRIQVEVFSLYDPNEICIQVLQEFETNIPLGSYPNGSYTVWLNGIQVGEFTQ
jgi:inhibitor of cysteine peptidase